MSKKIFTEEFKSQIIQEVKQIHNVCFVARKHGVSSRTVYNWVKKDANKKENPHSQELKKLKKELEESKLELMILKDLLKKTYQP